MRIWGIDFTSAPTKSKPITVAQCRLTDGELIVSCVRSLADFHSFEQTLRARGPWVAGIDMPFGQPRKLINAFRWPTVWKDYVARVERIGKTRFEDKLNSYRKKQPKGQKEHLRYTDKSAKSRSPMKLFFQPVGKMFFQGAPRLLRCGANIVPCAPNKSNRTIVEAYPALVADALAGTRNYKSDTKAKQTSEHKKARRKIADGLQSNTCRERYGLKVNLQSDTRKILIDDPKADLLDAVLCALQAAWASRKPRYGVPSVCDPSEGWIVDPTTSS